MSFTPKFLVAKILLELPDDYSLGHWIAAAWLVLAVISLDLAWIIGEENKEEVRRWFTRNLNAVLIAGVCMFTSRRSCKCHWLPILFGFVQAGHWPVTAEVGAFRLVCPLLVRSRCAQG